MIPLNTDTAGASLILNGETIKCFLMDLYKIL